MLDLPFFRVRLSKSRLFEAFLMWASHFFFQWKSEIGERKKERDTHRERNRMRVKKVGHPAPGLNLNFLAIK